MDTLNEILSNLPQRVSEEISMLPASVLADLEEIRMRCNQSVRIQHAGQERLLMRIVTKDDLQKTLTGLVKFSYYAYEEELAKGFVTINGGHRVGVCGKAVVKEGMPTLIKEISSVNIRFAKEIKGCANPLIPVLIEGSRPVNTLIVSPPGCGKTTLLRDIVRNISNGINVIGFKGKTVGVVDERGEIAAMYKGIPQNDIGVRTDVVDNMPKPEAMRMLVRSMAPDVIACDEIGSLEDINAIDYAMCSGVKGIFTAHGKDVEEISKNPELSKLLNKHVFERIILLNPKKRGDAECLYL